jgi:hypothetical protein
MNLLDKFRCWKHRRKGYTHPWVLTEIKPRRWEMQCRVCGTVMKPLKGIKQDLKEQRQRRKRAILWGWQRNWRTQEEILTSWGIAKEDNHEETQV